MKIEQLKEILYHRLELGGGVITKDVLDDVFCGVKNNVDKKFNFRNSLEYIGTSPQLINDYIELRRAKKLSLSKTVFDSLLKEIQKANVHPNDAIEMIVLKGWQGFKAEWYINEQFKNQNYGTNRENTLNGSTTGSSQNNAGRKTFG